MFVEGNIIRGTERSNDKYTQTNEYMTKAEVVEILEDGNIEIVVLEHEYLEDLVGEFVTVDGNYFELADSSVSGSGVAISRLGGNSISKPSGDYDELVAIGEL